MSDEELEKFAEHFGGKLPDPQHYPHQFAYYVRLWNYLKTKEVNHEQETNE